MLSIMEYKRITWLLPILAIIAVLIGVSDAYSAAGFNSTGFGLESINNYYSLAIARRNFRNAFPKNYEHQRASVIQQEELKATGGHLQLSSQELEVHHTFMNKKTAEMSRGFGDIGQHAPAMHFFHAKHLIEQSKVFKFLKQMPKGAILHMHNSASVSSQWVVNTLTYMPGMWSCYNAAGVLFLTFRKNAKRHQCTAGYKLVSEERAKASSAKVFDSQLEKHINLFNGNPETSHNNIDRVWRQFQTVFSTIGDVLSYVPAFRAFHKRMLEEMYEDKVMYAEVRMRFKPMFNEMGQDFTEEQGIQELIHIVDEFKKTRPDFFGIKIIFATSRSNDKKHIRSEFEIFKQWHALHPNFIIGFDLVGQEEKGQSALSTVIDVLYDMPKTAKFFFHAGETNWYGTSTDLNMLDAVLMNTARIGHGYALVKHPVIRKAVQDHKIAIEVSPISNQILRLVWDLRNHAGSFFLSEDVPMVITNDDPGFWGAKGLSYDMYYAIMSFAPSNAGLKTLKSLVWNSIQYSALNEQEKKKAFDMLTHQWNIFLGNVIHGKVV